MKEKQCIELTSDNDALLHTIINLGPVIDNTDREQLSNETAPFSVKTIMNIFLKSILLATQDSFDPAEVTQWAEEYAKMYMLNVLGVEDYPLVKLKGGELKGFSPSLKLLWLVETNQYLEKLL